MHAKGFLTLVLVGCSAATGASCAGHQGAVKPRADYRVSHPASRWIRRGLRPRRIDFSIQRVVPRLRRVQPTRPPPR